MVLPTQTGPPHPPPHRTFRAFANPSFRRLWSANFLLYVSRWMQMTLLAWLVLDLTDSPWFVALIGVFGWAPMLGLGLLGGLLADSVNRRRLLVATQISSLASTVGITVLLFAGRIEFWYAYFPATVGGISWALDMPSTRSIIHDLVGREGVTNAIALDSVSMSGSRLVGPALAGLLITLFEVKGGYVAVGALQLTSLGLLVLAKVPTGRRGEFRPAQMVRVLSEGLDYVRVSRILLATVAVTFLANLFLFPFAQMVPVIARDILNVGPGLMGLLLAADGLGALLGSALIASATRVKYHGRVYLGGTALAFLALLLFSFSRWYGLSISALVILGIGSAGFGAMQATIVILVAKADMRGRALGVVSLAIGAIPLGALMIGAVAEAVGPALAIRIMAGAGLVSMVLVGATMRRLWRYGAFETTGAGTDEETPGAPV